jgi:trehalose 6-phosphate synthase/phosphatase
MQPGLIIVSNRLPISVKKVNGKLEFYPSIGGLATGLSSYTGNKRNKWIGWPGVSDEEVTDEQKQQIVKEFRRHNCYPVFLNKKQLDNYYSGFSNSVLWPLFHELKPVKEALVNESYWRAYKRVNQAFAEVVLALSSSGSTIWVHDYQLLLLPAMLRAQRPDDKIGFFLHIPFPPPTIFEKIPRSKQILAGLIGADLVGFHTTGYVQNFLDSCQSLDIGAIGHKELLLPDRLVRVTDFPMGIDYAKYVKATKQKEIRRELLKLRTRYRGKKVILSVDRIDPTKGIPERLEAYQEFLRQNKALHRKVVMVMIAIPSRSEIEVYKNLQKRIGRLVNGINDEFGTARWTPVEYMTTPLSFAQLSPYFQLADVALVTPIRDGMNLVAKEYMASRKNRSGVLVLSETAGAAEELKDAILVNPREKSSLMDGMKQALTLPQRELGRRANKMQEQISTFTVQDWAGNFMNSLKATPLAKPPTRTLSPARQNQLREDFKRATKRQLLLDYDGVLVPLRGNPYASRPTGKVLRALSNLAALPDTEVIVVSGRSKIDLSEWLGEVPVTLVAEHGTFIKRAGSRRWQSVRDFDGSWRDAVLPILQVYNEKTPGAAIETKDAAVVWHYRQASPYYAQKHLVILKRLLSRYAKRYDLVIHQGNMILEVRPRGATKGHIAEKLLEKQPSFVIAIGDDYTDEDMFEALPSWAYTVKVGRGRTAARLRLQKPAEVIALLEKLAK